MSLCNTWTLRKGKNSILLSRVRREEGGESFSSIRVYVPTLVNCIVGKKVSIINNNYAKIFLLVGSTKWIQLPQKCCIYCSLLLQEAREQLLLDFVAFIYNENNPRRIDIAFGLLGSLVESSLVPSRYWNKIILLFRTILY